MLRAIKSNAILLNIYLPCSSFPIAIVKEGKLEQSLTQVIEGVSKVRN